MKQTTAANLGLVLAIAGWALAFYGAMSQLGDPSPSIAPARIEAGRYVSKTIMFIGVTAILSALWLSGYGFSLAKVRASLCTALVVLPSIAIVWGTLQ